MNCSKKLLKRVSRKVLTHQSGCAIQTGYTDANSIFSSDYGYSDKRINGDEFSIVVLGNHWTSETRVAEIALLRAANLTKEEGRTHFIIIKQKGVTTKTAVMENIVFPFIVGSGVLPIGVPVVEHTTKEPMAILLIRLLPLQPANSPEAINADEVIEHLAKHFGSD